MQAFRVPFLQNGGNREAFFDRMSAKNTADVQSFRVFIGTHKRD